MQRLREYLSNLSIDQLVKSRWVRALAEAAAVFLVAWNYLHHLQFIRPYLPLADSHYHIKFAQLLRTEGWGILRKFEWAQYSLWKDHFFDKDFGFHLLLTPFTSGDLVEGGKLAAVTFGALVFASFALVLRLRGVRLAWLWSLALCIGGSVFIYRMNVVRPQVLSVTLSLWSIYFVLRANWKAVFALGVLYALSYTAPHLVVIYAGALLVSVYLIERRWEYKPLLASVAGVLLGWLIHPSFPNTFRGVYVQIVGVLNTAWGSQVDKLDLGAELSPATTRHFLVQHGVLLMLGVVCVLILPRVVRRVTPQHLTLFLLSCGFLVLTAMSRRFSEYMVPVVLWTGAEMVELFLRDLDEGEAPWFLAHSRVRQVAMMLVGVMAFGVFSRSNAMLEATQASQTPSLVKEQALWLAENTPPGEIVFTCGWHLTSEFLFYNHHNRYLVFLDPNFMYQWDRDLWRRWTDIGAGVAADPITDIVEGFGAKYAFCHRHFEIARQRFKRDPRVTFISEGGAGYLFKIDPSLPAPPPQLRFAVSEPYPAARAQLPVQGPHSPPQPRAWTDAVLDTRPFQRIELKPTYARGMFSCVALRGTLTLPPQGVRVVMGARERARVWYGGELVFDTVGVYSDHPQAMDFVLPVPAGAESQLGMGDASSGVPSELGTGDAAAATPADELMVEVCGMRGPMNLSIRYEPLPAIANHTQPQPAVAGAEGAP